MMPRSTIGFIGIGAMGWPMAARLAPHHDLKVFDANRDRISAFADEVGGRGVNSIAQLAERCDAIITMLPTSGHVESVLCGPEGVLGHCREGALIIEMSSGAPEQTKALAQKAVAARCSMVDAPVSGGVPRARTGELSIMVGGAPEDVARAEPILKQMGSAILVTGPLGSGHAMKALNNLVSAATFLATVEALIIGKAAGLDPARMVDILNVSTGMSNSSQKKMHQYVLSGAFNSGFSLDLMVKDLQNAIGIAEAAHASAPFSSRCVELWKDAGTLLGPGQDHTALAKAIDPQHSLQVGRGAEKERG
jgi:3-hydroxyisobutyrate dehydrogenase